MKPIVTAKTITKRFAKPHEIQILTNVSLDIFPGQTLAITGKSGEGKTTLLHILGTLERPSSGELMFGLSASPAMLRNRFIGFVFQTYNLLEDCTVLENVLMPAYIARMQIRKGSPAYNHALALLEEVGLPDRSHFPAKLLSGGEKQRVAIARALCNDPELILADEPSGNLDHLHSRAIHQLLIGCAKRRNKALVVVTHDLELAKLCDNTRTLMDGVLH